MRVRRVGAPRRSWNAGAAGTLLAVALAVALSACGGDGEPAGARGSPTPTEAPAPSPGSPEETYLILLKVARGEVEQSGANACTSAYWEALKRRITDIGDRMELVDLAMSDACKEAGLLDASVAYSQYYRP